MGNNNGFTLIEIIMSFGILALVLLPTISIFASSVASTKVTQNSINAKYLAEKHMEIVKGSRINDLTTALTTIGDCNPEETEFLPNGITSCSNQELGLTVSWRPVRSITVNNEILPGDPLWTNILTLSGTNPVLTATNAGGTSTVTMGASIVSNISGDPIKVQLQYPAEPSNVTVYNQTGKKLEIYCVNTSPDYRDIPEFIIKEGRVAFYDYSRGADRLPEEQAGNQLPVEYEVTVTISNDVYYQIETVQALPLR